MKDQYSILKVRILIYLMNNEPEYCTVTRIGQTLGVVKQRVSKIIIDFEKEGFLTRQDRIIHLTPEGRSKAYSYAEKVRISLNHLLYEGVSLQQAEEDAYNWAINNSDATMDVIRKSEKLLHAKYEVRNCISFNGDAICHNLDDGEHKLHYVFHRCNNADGKNLSMANDGFLNPGKLYIENGVGKVCLQLTELKAKSALTHKVMTGRAEEISYYYDEKYIPVKWESGETISFPAKAINFVSIGEGINQILHGSLFIKIKSNVDTVHMPESEVMFTVII